MSQLLNFLASTEATIAGNSQGYIYSPHNLHYPGPSMEIKAGESFIIVPYQPLGVGPWTIFPSILINGELKIRKKRKKVLAIHITNRWLTKAIKLPHDTNLETLLATTGLEHYYTTLTLDDLEEINTNTVYTDDSVNDEKKTSSDTSYPPPVITCKCPCCLASANNK
jgi:hypothetical protein